jgi:DNA-binding MarR family transcriptional regulator
MPAVAAKQQCHKYHDLEEQMQSIKSFFTLYFRKTMATAVLEEKFDFSLAELKALSAFVDIHGEYTLSELSSNARVPLSNMTPIIKRLEKKNIVRKFRDAKDERYVHICLSEEGKQLLSQFMKRRVCEIENIIGRLGKAKQQELFEALKKAANILKELQ